MTEPLADIDAASLLAKFVLAFQRGLQAEIAAVQETADAFEIQLRGIERLGDDSYRLELSEASNRLAVGTECRLQTARGDALVTVAAVDGRHVMASAMHAIDVTAAPMTLVLSPRFLYDRLVEALSSIAIESHGVLLALTLFGKGPAPARTPCELRGTYDALNSSQLAALRMCIEHRVAFVWGPPGTGKTETLVRIVEELRARGKRILLASTTNAAIDHVLAKLASQPWFEDASRHGEIVRLGRSDGDTYGVELGDLVARAQSIHRGTVDRLRARMRQIEPAIRDVDAALAQLRALDARQQSLFAAHAPAIDGMLLARILSREVAARIQDAPVVEQEAILERRRARLDRVQNLARQRIAEHTHALHEAAARIVDRARIVTSTLTNLYLSPLMKSQRFDVLIAEEAGMAAPPPLFYAACMCREHAIAVGDPRQLRPIVVSTDEIAVRTLGRSVFEIATTNPDRAGLVKMLETQYRMHPRVGSLVGHFFYGGRLESAGALERHESIAARAPYPGQPLVVVDTSGRTTCTRAETGSSRSNAASAAIVASLACEAAAAGASSVAVISPYTLQTRDLRRRVHDLGGEPIVECSTIHRFQGREADVVIIDMVDAEPLRPGVLLVGGADASNLLNVCISRARGKLIIVADVSYFEARAAGALVTEVIAYMIRSGLRIRT